MLTPFYKTGSFRLAAAIASAAITPDLAIAQSTPFTPIGTHIGTASVSSGSTGFSRIALMGDVTGDGVRDLAMSTQGRAEMLDGATGASLGSWSYPGPVFVAAVNDADGDGVPDLMIGAPYVNVVGGRSGIIDTVSGATGSVTRLQHGTWDSYFGMSLCRIEDIDGDGRDDLACGANHDTLGGGWGPNGGACYQVSTASGALLTSSAGTGYFGSTVSVGPDINGDGVEDFVVSRGYNSPASGFFRVYSGASGSLHWESSSPEIYYGLFHDVIEDVSGDGIRDVVAVGDTFLTLCSGLDGSQIAQFPLPKPEPGLGHPAHVRDCSAVLGMPAIALGWPESSVAGPNTGTVVIFDPTFGSVLTSLHGQIDGAEFGSALLARDDWNGDGQPDLAVSSKNYDSSGMTLMRVDVFSGAPDCNGNGIPDADDLAQGTSSDCNANGIPDECDILADASLDCDGDLILDSCQIAADPSLDWNGDGLIDGCAGGSIVYCDGNLNGAGFVGRIAPQGSPVVSDDGFSLHASDLPLGQPGMFIMSRASGYMNPFGGGAGVLCLGAPIRRFNPTAGFPLQFTGATGEITLTPPIAQFPGPNPVQPGDVIFFQLWHRENDPITGFPRSNTTDGISVMFR